MTVTGSKTGSKYEMAVGDKGRTFTGPDGQAITEAQMKALEGDWTQGVGNVQRYTAPGGQSVTKEQSNYLGGQKMDDGAYKAAATPQPGLGELAKRLAGPKPTVPTQPQVQPQTQQQPQKVGDMGAGGQFDIEAIKRLLGVPSQPQQMYQPQQQQYGQPDSGNVPANLAQAILMWHLTQGQNQGGLA